MILMLLCVSVKASQIRDWLDSNKRLVKALEDLITDETSKLHSIELYLDQLLEIESKSKLNQEMFLVNALSTFILTKRLTIDFDSWKSRLEKNPSLKNKAFFRK